MLLVISYTSYNSLKRTEKVENIILFYGISDKEQHSQWSIHFTPFPKPVIMEVYKYVYVTDCDNGSPSRVEFEFSNNCPDNYGLCQFRL